MDELIGRLAAKAGVNDAVAEKNIGIITGFLRSEGFSHNVRALINRIPGADAAISASGGERSDGIHERPPDGGLYQAARSWARREPDSERRS